MRRKRETEEGERSGECVLEGREAEEQIINIHATHM